MERVRFESHLRIATDQAIEFARQFVRQELPGKAVFLIYPNQSCDENPRVGDEVVYPEDSLLVGQNHGPWSAAEAMGFLWRAGKIPEWIDVAVRGRTVITPWWGSVVVADLRFKRICSTTADRVGFRPSRSKALTCRRAGKVSRSPASLTCTGGPRRLAPAGGALYHKRVAPTLLLEGGLTWRRKRNFLPARPAPSLGD